MGVRRGQWQWETAGTFVARRAEVTIMNHKDRTMLQSGLLVAGTAFLTAFLLLAAPGSLLAQEERPDTTPGDTIPPQERIRPPAEDTAGEETIGLEAEPGVVPEAEPTAPAPEVQRLLSNMHRGNQMEIRLGELAREKAEWDKVRAYGDLLARDHKMGDMMVQKLAAKKNVALTPSGPEMAPGGEPRPGRRAQPAEPRPEDIEEAPAAREAEEPEAEKRAEAEAEREFEPARRTYEDTAPVGRPPEEVPPGEMPMPRDEMRPERPGMPAPGPSPEEVLSRLEAAPPGEFDRMYLEANVRLHEQTIGKLQTARETLPEDSEARGLVEDLLPILEQHRELASALLEDMRPGELEEEAGETPGEEILEEVPEEVEEAVPEDTTEEVPEDTTASPSGR